MHSLSLSLSHTHTHTHTYTLREAVEHFLIALNMQRQAKGPGNNRRQMSESIWSTLRLAVNFVGKQGLNKLVDNRDLDGLMREFSV